MLQGVWASTMPQISRNDIEATPDVISFELAQEATLKSRYRRNNIPEQMVEEDWTFSLLWKVPLSGLATRPLNLKVWLLEP